ncbi:MAG: hypothetical protein JNL53_09060 [Cyclobacteriaceae bacterium]|nr:hypothetical protein [Cyclobacteriaceae bacterium]
MKKIKYIISIVLGITLIVLLIVITKQRIELAYGGRYTIAVTDGLIRSSGGNRVKFYFEVLGQQYVGEHKQLKYNPETSGGRYFLKYLPHDPKINNILWDKPVPSQLKEVPVEGWKEIPNY